MSSYEKVKRAKLSFKGGLEPSKKIDKKKKKKTKTMEGKNTTEEDGGQEHHDGEQNTSQQGLDDGIGHAPDGGKKSKQYEELFPVETKRFGYHTEKALTREEALEVRVKQKADRYCK